MKYKIAAQFSPMFKKAIAEGVQKCDTLWPITQKIVFDSCKGKSRNGYCKRISDTFYEIHINTDMIVEEEIMTTVIHEVLHSYPTVFSQGHKGEWLNRANVINQKYGLQIQRCNDVEKKLPDPKFIFKCTNCNYTWNYSKTPKWIHRISACTCSICKTRTIVMIKGEVPPLKRFEESLSDFE